MAEYALSIPATRPAECPFCKGKAFGTMAKAITMTSLWRCRNCEGTWTIGGRVADRNPGDSLRD